MTNERIAIENLARCTFLPGSWNKRFAKGLVALPENHALTVKQRECLWKLVYRYRRQIKATMVLDAVEKRRKWCTDQAAFENILDGSPDDAATRLVYADWLDEHNQPDLAMCQRWMVEHSVFPHLTPGGMSYESGGSKPINYEWSFGMEAWEMFGKITSHPNQLQYWHHDRQIAEERLTQAILATKKMQVTS